MAKKRKASARVADEPKGPNMDVGESRKRIRTYEDVADSDDEFHMNRDEVLLNEEPDAKRRRNWQEQEDFLQPSDEEVLGEDDEDEDNIGDEVDSEIDQQANSAGNISEEEASEKEEDEDDEGWGTSKADLYGADAIETEEQALEEEKEALRLQKKQLQSMSAADYGFDEAEWQDADAGASTKANQQKSATVTEVLPQPEISNDLAPSERLKLLRSMYPEFEPLSKELNDLRHVQAELAGQVKDFRSSDMEHSTPNVVTKHRAASAYLGALTMYFALLTSTAPKNGGKKLSALPANSLRDHPLMDTLVRCRNLWQTAQQLPADARPLSRATTDVIGNFDTSQSKSVALVSGDDKPKARKSRAQRHAEAVQLAEKARRASRMKNSEADFADLDALLAPGAGKKITKAEAVVPLNGATDDSDIGEETPLTAQEAAEKAKRRKSLRFYTSQIAQKANKRGAAGRNAGGDDDIPHRERLRDRQTRLNAEAEKRGHKHDLGDDLGGNSDDEDHEQARRIREEAGDDDYYDMVAARTAKKKSDKAAFADAQREAALSGGRVVEEAIVGADGKRKITYAIEKNKGLTPHRKKDVRNPRVKKRKKYEEKKKKFASMRPVYKGGEGRGGYGGELTGIKKGLVKSTKLS